MTYEERERQLCNNCEAKENCSYISRNLESKCSFRETTMYGWELGYKDAIDKACKWFEEHLLLDDPKWYVEGEKTLQEKMIDDLRKAMEEQQ